MGCFSLSEAALADFSLPPEPNELPVRLGIELHLDTIFPLIDRHLCPRGGKCIFGAGSGIGGGVQWRRASGWFVGVSYDAWFLSGNGVYELTTLQTIQATVHYQWLPQNQVHPWCGAALGALILGDTFGVETGGALVDLQFGIEIEISPSLAFTGGVLVRLLTVTPFRTASDGTDRGRHFGINGAGIVRLGLVLLVDEG